MALHLKSLVASRKPAASWHFIISLLVQTSFSLLPNPTIPTPSTMVNFCLCSLAPICEIFACELTRQAVGYSSLHLGKSCELGTCIWDLRHRNLCRFAKAAVMEYHRLGDLNNRNLFAHSPEGWESEIKVTPGLVSFEVSLFGLQTATLSLLLHLFSL